MRFKLVEELNRVVGHKQQVRSLLRYEARGDCMLDESQEAIEEASSVQKANRTIMNSYLFPCPAVYNQSPN